MFKYSIPTDIYFGKGQLKNLGSLVYNYGSKALLVYGGGSIKKTGLYDLVTEELEKYKISFQELSGIEPNPKIDSVRKGIEICKNSEIDFVIAVGGGSVMDAAKFICAGAKVNFDVWDFITKDKPVQSVLPLFCIPTVAATGSEMDNTAVLNNPETKDKLALINDKLFPLASFCDPSLTYSVNAYHTACGSADILSHLMEVYFNENQYLYMLDTQMEGMMKAVIKFGPIALKDPQNYQARANLMWTSTWAINGYTYGCKKHPWSCHAMEHSLSAVYNITHGLGLAILTPRWMDYVLDETKVDKFYNFAVNVFGLPESKNKMKTALEGIDCLRDFFYCKLELPSSLSAIGLDDSEFEYMAQKACGVNGFINGWKKLFPRDVIKIYKKSL